MHAVLILWLRTNFYCYVQAIFIPKKIICMSGSEIISQKRMSSERLVNQKDLDIISEPLLDIVQCLIVCHVIVLILLN